MKEDKLYIDYMPGVWYGAEFDPPMHCDLVILIRHAVHKGVRILKLASYSPYGWLIRDFGERSKKDWEIEQWLMLPRAEGENNGGT